MSLLLSEASAAGGTGSIIYMIGWIVLFGGLMYFMFYRPQKKEQKRMESLLATMAPGDSVLTTSGFYGVVIDVTDEEVTLDLKYYTQGIVKAEDLSDDPNFSILDDVKIGDEIQATVVKTDDGHGNILLSKKEARISFSWNEMM